MNAMMLLLPFLSAVAASSITYETWSNADCSGTPTSTATFDDAYFGSTDCVAGVRYKCDGNAFTDERHANSDCSDDVSGTACTISTTSSTFSGCTWTYEYDKCVTYFDITTPLSLASSGKISGSCSGAEPCFARFSTTACKVSPGTAAAEAYPQCFGDEPPTTAEPVLMSSLVAGDLVLADPTSATRVIVNQHVPSAHTSKFVTLHYDGGALTLTPDHVLQLDGKWAPARLATAGSRLSNGGEVTRVTAGVDAIINPLTTSGTILANGVVASVYPEWIAEHMLGTKLYPLPLSACNALTYLFPAASQAFYDAALEPLFDGNRKYLEAVPATLVTPAILFFDLLIAAAFVATPALAIAGAARLTRKPKA